jgi:hypothetical protein
VSRQFAAGANRRLKFEKCRQLFLCSDNEMLSVAAMRVSNEDGSTFGINRCNTAPSLALLSLSAIISCNVYEIRLPKDCRGFD